MEKARRPHVPAFGEWNYHHHQYDEPVAAVAPAAAFHATPEREPEGRRDVVGFRYSPPPRKPTPKKQARRRPPNGDVGVARDAATSKSGASRRVVRPVDEDLYQVPPPVLCPHRRPRKKRSLWMGCLGCAA